MAFKVPIGYRQLEDNITEVVYDDNTTWDWVNGSGGGDDEGDESMLITVRITVDGDGELDKNYKEIKEAVEAGKVCFTIIDGGVNYLTYYGYNPETLKYIVTFACGVVQEETPVIYETAYFSDTETGVLTSRTSPN